MAEPTSAVERELAAATGLARSDYETGEAYLNAVAEAVTTLPETEWVALSDEAQEWGNIAGFSIDHKEPIPTFDDVDAIKERRRVMDEVDKAKAAKAKAPKAKPEKAAKAAKAPKAAKAKAPKAKPEKAAKAAKAPKAAKANGSGTGRGRASSFAPTAKIHLLVKENPHREGSGRFKRWSKYREGMTVAQALDAGFNWGNLYHSVNDGHISIK